MTVRGWLLIGGGLGAVLGFLMHAPFPPEIGATLGAATGLLVFSPFVNWPQS